ncbi:MAG: hypothetical protein AAB455_01445 [Patescibacteria group bacterium]|mgnify:CR=1 FL=1
MMAEDQLKDLYGGRDAWKEFTEEEQMFLFELHCGNNHRVPPDREEQVRREVLWKSIRDKQTRLIRRRGNGQASGSGRR